MLLREDASSVSDDDFPDDWVVGDLALPLSYQFEPGTAADGVTVHIPLPVLNRVTPDGLRLAGPGAAARPGHRAAEVAAQGAAPQLRART